MVKLSNEVLQERLENHMEDDRDKWEKTFRLFNTMDGKLDTVVDWISENKFIPDKVAKLWDFHQQNKGFLSATRLLTGGAGGFIGGAAVLLVEWFHR